MDRSLDAALHVGRRARHTEEPLYRPTHPDGVLYDVHACVARADAHQLRHAHGEQGEDDDDDDDDARGTHDGCGARERGGRRRGYGH